MGLSSHLPWACEQALPSLAGLASTRSGRGTSEDPWKEHARLVVPGTRGQAPGLGKSLVLSSERGLRGSSGIREMALATVNLQAEYKDGAGPHAPTQRGQAVMSPQPPALTLGRWEGAVQTQGKGD